MKFTTETKFLIGLIFILNQKLIYVFTDRIYRIKITNLKVLKKIVFLNSIFLNEIQKINVKSFEI